MHTKVIRKLIWAQLCYFGFLAVCVIINTGGFREDRGLSFYGEHLQTVVPYGLGTIGCSWLMLQASHFLSEHEEPYNVIRIALRGMAALLTLLLITPDNFGQFLNLSHEIVAFILFVSELVLAAWLAFIWSRDILIRLLLAVQLMGGLVAMLSEFNVMQFLSQSSLLFQLGFCVLLIRALVIVPHVAKTKVAAKATENYQAHNP